MNIIKRWYLQRKSTKKFRKIIKRCQREQIRELVMQEIYQQKNKHLFKKGGVFLSPNYNCENGNRGEIVKLPEFALNKEQLSELFKNNKVVEINIDGGEITQLVLDKIKGNNETMPPPPPPRHPNGRSKK